MPLGGRPALGFPGEFPLQFPQPFSFSPYRYRELTVSSCQLSSSPFLSHRPAGRKGEPLHTQSSCWDKPAPARGWLSARPHPRPGSRCSAPLSHRPPPLPLLLQNTDSPVRLLPLPNTRLWDWMKKGKRVKCGSGGSGEEECAGTILWGLSPKRLRRTFRKAPRQSLTGS